MFHPITQNVFEGFKFEPINYYMNSATDNNYTPHHPYGAFIAPEVSLNYPPEIKQESGIMEQDVSIETDQMKLTDIKSQLSPNEKRTKTQTCKICNKTLASSSSYYVHMKQHSDNKPFSCSRCDAAFCRKPYLEVHMRVHTGERPYQCEICKKRFTQKSSLNTHKRGHSGLRPYACQLCSKTFTVKSYLTAHQWTHIADSGVICNKCDISFTNKNLYLQHMQTHVRKEFVCRECSKAFAKESYLIRHVNRIHNKNDTCVSDLNSYYDNGAKE